MINKDKRKYFTAGELAAIFNISKQSLLYYDKVNLLSPDFVSENGYRNYSIQQFLDLEIIVNLRALDISIANIKKYLEDRSKEHFLQLLQEKTAECQAIIHNNQEICDTIERIKEDMHVKELNPCRHLTLSWQNDRLLRLTPLAESDDGKSRITKFARHGQRRAHHKGALPNHAGWVLDQESFFKKHEFQRSVRSHRADSVKAILDIVRKGVVLSITRENFYVREEVSLSTTFRKILLTYCSQSQENQ